MTATGNDTGEQIRTIAAFRRAMTPGTQYRVTNYRHPNVSGPRTVLQSGPGRWTFSFEKADGSTGTNGRADWPRALQADFARREDGGTDVHMLDPDGETVAYTIHLPGPTAAP